MHGAAGKINGYVISLRRSQIGSGGGRRSRAEKRSTRNEKSERCKEKGSEIPTDGFAQTRNAHAPPCRISALASPGSVSLPVHARRHVTLSSCRPCWPMSAPQACIHLLFPPACQPCNGENGSMAASVSQLLQEDKRGARVCRRCTRASPVADVAPGKMNKESGSRCRPRRQISKTRAAETRDGPAP